MKPIGILFICVLFHSNNLHYRPVPQRLDIDQNNPDPFFEDQSTTIRYRALGAEEFSIIVYNDDGKKVLVYDQLKEQEGKIVIKPYELTPGKYRYALLVYNRLGPRKHMTVLKKKETQVEERYHGSINRTPSLQRLAKT